MSEATEEKRYLTVGDLAKRFSVSADTIYRMINDNQLPRRVKIGKRDVWYAQSIIRWEVERLTEAGIEP